MVVCSGPWIHPVSFFFFFFSILPKSKSVPLRPSARQQRQKDRDFPPLPRYRWNKMDETKLWLIMS